MASRALAAARQVASGARISSQPSANLVQRRGLAGSAGHHGPPKVNFWQDPMSPSKWKEEHLSRTVVFPCTSCRNTIINEYVRTCSTFTTQASYHEEEAADRVLNRVIFEIDSDPSSCIGICFGYVDKLCKAGNVSAAERLVDCLRNRKVYIGSKVYDILLAAASERNDVELSFKIFKYILLSGESPSSMSYLRFAKSFVGNEDRGRLVVLVKEILKMTFSSVTVANRIVYAFAECGQFNEAILIFEEIKNGKCKADLYTYNTVLGILGRVGRVDEMLDVFASMKDAGIIPDIVSCNTLLNSLKKVGRLDLCLVILKEMDECGIQPDLRTYTALIESFGRSGNAEQSLRLFNEMKMRQIQPSIYIYRSLIHNLKKMGKLDMAVKYLEEMNSLRPELVGPDQFRPKEKRGLYKRHSK